MKIYAQRHRSNSGGLPLYRVQAVNGRGEIVRMRNVPGQTRSEAIERFRKEERL